MQNDQNQSNDPPVYSTSHYVDGLPDAPKDSVTSSPGATEQPEVNENMLDAPNPYPDYAYPKRKDPRA